jgi:phosphoribosylformimino-5-aminoimidazole carboxamide ribotide isomerase
MFTILPAIDLKGGRCVRLRQGRADEETVYGEDPVAMARQWRDLGARWLHVVDLDGAFRGEPVHTALVGEIARAAGIPVELGGGLRTTEQVRLTLDAGASRAVIGTRALAEPEALEALAREFGPRLAVGIDARDGLVQVRGWVEGSSVRAVDLAAEASRRGVRTIIYTDIATDGMLTGPNLPAVADVCDAVSCEVIASGGVHREEDVDGLLGLRRDNLAGVIVGKALYEGTVTLPGLLARAGTGG